MKKLPEIPADALSRAEIKLDEVSAVLRPLIIRLNDSGKQIPRKNRSSMMEFVEFSHKLAAEYPRLFPGFTRESLFGDAYAIARSLRDIAGKLDNLKEIIDAVELLALSKALEIALEYFETIKIAARRDYPGAGLVYDELKHRLPARPGRKRNKKRAEGTPKAKRTPKTKGTLRA